MEVVVAQLWERSVYRTSKQCTDSIRNTEYLALGGGGALLGGAGAEGAEEGALLGVGRSFGTLGALP